MNKEQVRTLLEKYRTGMLSGEERAILESWYLDQISNRKSALSDDEMQLNLQLVRQVVMGEVKPNQRATMFLWSAAAAIFVIISAATWYFIEEISIVDGLSENISQHDVMPGGNKATLTLADGRSISLSTDQNGIVIVDNVITYLDGSSVLESRDEDKASTLGDQKSLAFMSISTPKGGTYQIELPDGTNVWLNAASTLRYPSRFDDEERKVELEGEAYFDVQQRKSEAVNQLIPFIVKCKGQEITVLGTEFNVSAYIDEPTVKTTLVTGKVKVFAPTVNREVLLSPGQEAIFSGNDIGTRQANVASAVAWKSGKFRFDETELHDIMTQLGRWYDLDIEYHGTVPTLYFYGVINRNQTLVSVLKVLKEGGVNFRIENAGGTKKLIVLP